MEEAMMAASHRERTRALFKKGQKCIIPIVETDKESGEDKMKYYEAMVGDMSTHAAPLQVGRVADSGCWVAGDERGEALPPRH